MTPQELKDWRENRRLSQEEAAKLLGASDRHVVYRWENGAELPTTIAARIAEADKYLAGRSADVPILVKRRTKGTLLPYGCLYLTKAVQPTTHHAANALPPESMFWEYDHTGRDGKPHYNLMQTSARTGKGQCTPVRMETRAWRSYGNPLYAHHAGVLKATAEFQAWFDAHRAELDQIPFQSIITTEQNNG